jgi:hypothetical protein
MEYRLTDLELNQVLRLIDSYESFQIESSKLKEMLRSKFWKQIEKKLILTCINNLEERLNSNFYYEYIDQFFKIKGYDIQLIKQTEFYKGVMEKFYLELLEFEDFDDEIISKLEEMRDNDVDFSNVKDFLNNWIEGYSQLQNLFQYTETILDQIEKLFIEEIKNHIFMKSSQSYQNVKEYLELIKEDYEDEDDFYNCLQSIDKIKNGLEKINSTSRSKRNLIQR